MMLDRIKRWFRRDPEPDPPVTFDSESFWYRTRKGDICRFPWGEIIEIRAYKIDLFTIDEVRFAFQMDGWWGEVNEEQPGFPELVKELARRFPSVVGWEDKVIKPAFKRNETVLYETSSNERLQDTKA